MGRHRHLEQLGEEVRIDQRSHAARGLPELPIVHEGVIARTMERNGYTSDRCELNRQIKVDNAYLRELRRQMERIAKTTQQHTLTNEKKQTPAWSLLKKRDLTQHINALAEDKDMAEIRKWTKQQETAIQPLNAQESRCQAETNTALEEYKHLYTHAANFVLNALWPERLRERASLTAEARAELKTRLGADYSERRLDFAEQRLRELLPEEEWELQRYSRELQYILHTENSLREKKNAR